MKFLQPNPRQSVDLFRMLAHKEGYTLSDSESTKQFISKLGEEFTRAKSNPIMLYGFHVQAMFEYVAASLGKCAIVKTEDVGSLHTIDSSIKIPDFRVLLIDGKEFFVEVKNFYQSSPLKEYRIKKGYLEELQRYASLFKKDIKLAIYWSKWTTWTLTALDKLKCEGGKCSLPFEDAMKYNEMALLGDYIIGTLPPLKFRVITNPACPRTVNANGEVVITIGGIKLYCGDEYIAAPHEQSFALFMMLYGEWPSEAGEACIENGELISFDFISRPEESHPEQVFETIGSLSGMISRRFITMTTHEGNIQRLDPQTDFSDLGIQIPDDYQGEVLHLWRFTQQSPIE